MSRPVAAGAPVIFELLDYRAAEDRTPYGKEKFKRRFGHLYRLDPDGGNAGFLASDLQAEVESWPFKDDVEKAS